MAQLPCIGLYKQCINLPFGDCAMYFDHWVTDMKFDPWSLWDNAVQYVNQSDSQSPKKTRIGLLFFLLTNQNNSRKRRDYSKDHLRNEKIIDIKDASCLESSSGSFWDTWYGLLWCHGCCNPQVDGPSDEDDAGRKKPCCRWLLGCSRPHSDQVWYLIMIRYTYW